MTKWYVEILFCVESHVFVKAAKSLKASEDSSILLYYFIESLIDSERKHTILTLEP